MANQKSIKEINHRISRGEAVVMTAEEIIGYVKEHGIDHAFETVDVVTTATFGPMCSSGAFLNFGHTEPPMRLEQLTLNNVTASGGLAAVDTYIGATDEDPDSHGSYGGAHVICDLIAGKEVTLKATAKGTDCYPRTAVERTVTLKDLNEAFLFNPRNAYQNYAAATNLSSRTIHTYMGTLLPEGKNVTYSTTGQLSPLLNDPYLRTIGVGTRIFLAGATGYVSWNGTQYASGNARYANGIPKSPAATLTVIGDLKEMDPEYITPAVFHQYGVSLNVGIGIPIPILDKELLEQCAVSDEEIRTTILDYSAGSRSKPTVKTVTYAELRSGEVLINDVPVKTAPLSSLKKAREIANILKAQIEEGSFTLTEPVKTFDPNGVVKPMVDGED